MKVVKDRSGHRVAAGILAAGTAGLAAWLLAGQIPAHDPASGAVIADFRPPFAGRILHLRIDFDRCAIGHAVDNIVFRTGTAAHTHAFSAAGFHILVADWICQRCGRCRQHQQHDSQKHRPYFFAHTNASCFRA